VGYPVKAVANYFVLNYRQHGITPLKIQKLIYLAHGWHLAYICEPLVIDEYVEAWPHGPVFPSIYHAFKYLGRKPIIEPIIEFSYRGDYRIEMNTPGIPKSDKLTCKLLARIWDEYGKFSGNYLSELTHQEKSPWSTARKSEKVKTIRNIKIDNDLIESYYKRLKDA